eukprot:TRINITY_DN42757_c0_g1_i1.p1 TRINITY_DN42757_c0_g1~~TRINITY_DN42757_c0_g1_i1.p1  ORF type:complete len:1001 (-),score=155.67 TRINITY_DN42757_c0_g1_i1:240-3242(-)
MPSFRTAAAFASCLLLACCLGSSEGDAGTCNARDGSCAASEPGKQGNRQRNKAWWNSKEGRRFKSSNVISLNTLNFNKTLTDLWNESLLVAFFDPRSKSFADLRLTIEETADTLAASSQGDGKSLGHIAALDVTVDSYLSEREAPEVRSAWQDTDKGTYRFGRPRFLPLVIIFYRNGKRHYEYTDVVKKQSILDFLRRQQAPAGGWEISETSQLRRILDEGPGPFAIACGLDSRAHPASLDDSQESSGNASEINKTQILENATLAFNESAHVLSGTLVFAKVPHQTCLQLFDLNVQSGPSSPQMLYVRSTAVAAAAPGQLIWALSNSTPEVIADRMKLMQWFATQRTSVLEEITPDNSWKYLDNAAPLVIFMVDERDTQARAQGEALFGTIESRLQEKYYQLVWADCKEFGAQFKVTHRCPVVMVVDMATSGEPITNNVTMRQIQEPSLDLHTADAAWKAAAVAAAPGERLLLWLENVTGNVRKMIDDHYQRITNASANTTNRTDNANDTGSGNTTEGNATALEEVDDSAADSSGNFLEEWIDPHDANTTQIMNGSLAPHFERYHFLLYHMVKLRESFESVYGNALDFNFSILEKVQKQHKHMSNVVSSTEEVRKIIQDKATRKKVWKAMEERVHFLEKDLEELDKPQNQQKKHKLFKAVLKSHRALRALFRKLYTFLEAKARKGTLGVSEPSVQNVARRKASEMSVKEFIERYAKPGVPVIITGLNVTEEDPWTLDFFKKHCNVSVNLVRRNPKRDSWGRLEAAGQMSLPEFIDTFGSNATRRKWYLHDWSLPRFCPAVFGPPPFKGFTVPKYFAGDYFQRAAFEGYQHSWPSLFVGSSETMSAMHIDSGNTNFILHLLSGKKEWRFYRRRDLLNLYPSPMGPHFHLDVFKPDYNKFPLARYAAQFLGIQEAGELIFIPAANPHGVRNLEDIHGISMNYVDASNIELSLLENFMANDVQKIELYTDGKSIPHGLRSDQQPLRFGEWKGTDWKSLQYDLY